MKNIIVAIDGHSGCGKSSTAKGVARKLRFTYIDSGAMYRAATLYLMRLKLNPNDEIKIQPHLREIQVDFEQDAAGNFITLLNGENVEKEIRSLEISSMVSKYSMLPQLREAMVEQQRKLSHNRNVIMDGRDIGTVVFPNADLKIFMTADLETRAKRRQIELTMQGKEESLESVKLNLSSRDKMDTTRQSSPLIQAPDAVVVDTSNLTLDDQIDLVAGLAKAKMG